MLDSLCSVTGKVHFVSAPCATGKTLETAKIIQKNRLYCNFLYVAPTIQLCEQMAGTLLALGATATRIDGATHPDTVIIDIIAALKQAPESGLRGTPT